MRWLHRNAKRSARRPPLRRARGLLHHPLSLSLSCCWCWSASCPSSTAQVCVRLAHKNAHMYCNSRTHTHTHTRFNIVREEWGGGRKCQELFDFAAIRMQLILLGRGFIVVVVDGNCVVLDAVHILGGREQQTAWHGERVWRVQCWYELRMYIVRNTMCIDGHCIANISTHELHTHTHMWDGWFVACCVILDILPIAASLC